MKPFDPPIWAKQREELLQDETGKNFLEFLEFWVDAAEVKMTEEIHDLSWGYEQITTMPPTHAVREAFPVAELQFGRQSPVHVSQMLALLCVHWYYRDALFEGLTVIEKYFVQAALEAKIAQLGEDAAL